APIPCLHRTCRPRSLVAAAAAARRAFAAAGGLARLVDVLYVGARHRIAIQRHDRVGEAVALVGLHPGLDAAAGRQDERHAEREEDAQLAIGHENPSGFVPREGNLQTLAPVTCTDREPCLRRTP